jgi:putative MFS transporter
MSGGLELPRSRPEFSITADPQSDRLLGIAIGADYPLSSAYLAECVLPSKRGRMLSLSLGFWMAGAICSALVGFFLLSTGPFAWRWMLISGAVPGMLVLALRKKLPESPIWLHRRERVKWKVSRYALRKWIFACVPRFCLDVTGYALHLYLPLVLLSIGVHTMRDSILGNAGFLAVFVFGWALNLKFVDKVGRVPLQLIGFLGTAAGLALVAGAAWRGTPDLAVVALGLIIYQIASFAGPGVTSWILPVELFPTGVRATAQGVSTAIAHAGGLMAAVILPFMLQHLGVAPTILGLAGTAAVGAAVTARTGLETSGVVLA